VACGGRSSVTGPTTQRARVPYRAYAHYIRARVAEYDRDYAEAVRELALARREAPGDAELRDAMFRAILLQLAAPEVVRSPP
jgi:hypothetical protein